MVRGRPLQRVALTLFVLVPMAVRADTSRGPVLHEYFDPDERDLTNRTGDTARVQPGPPGVTAGVGASAEQASHSESLNAIQRYSSDDGAYERYQLDADTRRPEGVAYDDPFSPSIPPFKRLFAYDTLTDDFALAVAGPALTKLPIGGTATEADDQFFARLTLDVTDEEPIRIPSVGPTARVLAGALEPPAPLTVMRDSAENWFVTGLARGTFELTLHLAIERRVFGSDFADSSFRDLKEHLPPVSPRLRIESGPVLSRLGLTTASSPKAALERLVRHFRSFEPTSVPTAAGVAGRLYQDIALGQLGVCRHRSFAFVATALALGIPARFVRNEAHAWVEAFDGQYWHRIDLGGAASQMHVASQFEVRHAPPPDPFEWPSATRSGDELAGNARTLPSPSGDPAGSSQAAGSEAVAPSSASGVPIPAPDLVDEPSATPRQEAVLTLEVAHPVVSRGAQVRVSGRVVTGSEPCALEPVGIYLRGDTGKLRIGTLVTGSAGGYSGALSIPSRARVGDYDIVAELAPESGCGPAVSE